MDNKVKVDEKRNRKEESESTSSSHDDHQDQDSDTSVTDTENSTRVDETETKVKKRTQSSKPSKSVIEDNKKPKKSSPNTSAQSDTTTLPKQDSSLGKYAAITLLAAIILWFFSNQMTDSDSNIDDWRSKIDPDRILSDNQRHIVHASLKSIMEKSSNKEGVSTLLIVSPNEESAAKTARCLLKSINTETHKHQVQTEIDLSSHRGGKLQLDKDLRSLLSPGGPIRAVLLRHIDDQSTSDAFDRTRLLFAYCDGENPVVPHRLIIMTATSISQDESELRENFKTSWPNEHDYVDALMSRISGHTLFVEKDQKSIC